MGGEGGGAPQAEVADEAWPLSAQLEQLQQLYGTRTVLLSTDDHTGEVLRTLQQEKGFNWVFLEYPRAQFRKRAWMVRRVTPLRPQADPSCSQTAQRSNLGRAQHACGMRRCGMV